LPGLPGDHLKAAEVREVAVDLKEFGDPAGIGGGGSGL